MKIKGTASLSAGQSRDSAVPFFIGFDHSSGDLLVYGMLFLGLVFLGIGAGAQNTGLTAFTLPLFALAFWNYPLIDKSAPQLGANAEGVFIERLGLIPWAEIKSLRVERTSVRSILVVRLVLSLHRPLKDTAFRPHHFPAWKRFMMRNWRRKTSKASTDQFVIDLHSLSGDPDETVSALAAFAPHLTPKLPE